MLNPKYIRITYEHKRHLFDHLDYYILFIRITFISIRSLIFGKNLRIS